MQTKKQYGPVWRHPGGLIGCRGFCLSGAGFAAWQKAGSQKYICPKTEGYAMIGAENK
jgi:hypothetical protein